MSRVQIYVKLKYRVTRRQILRLIPACFMCYLFHNYLRFLKNIINFEGLIQANDKIIEIHHSIVNKIPFI